MPGYADERGLELTAAGAEAAETYAAAVREYLEYRASAGDTLKAALAADPGFAMAHCLRGYLLLLLATRATRAGARKALEAGRSRAAELTWRERAHLAALEAWSAGDTRKAGRVWDDILLEHPLDLLALRLHHFNAFWSGAPSEVQGGPARVLHAWDESVPGYGCVLGMRAFGREECGDYAGAEADGRRAAELNGDDLWAIHAVAHVYEMQGRLAEGERWFDRPPEAWDDRNPFKNHLWWHAALFPLERGDGERALAVYDRVVRAETPGFYLDVQNAASLLFRLEAAGLDVGDRWRPLADIAEERVGDHVLPFTDVHFMLALVADGRAEAARALVDSLADFAAQPEETAAEAVHPVAIPVCEAIRAHGAGDPERAVELLLPVRRETVRLGASHAQRDLLEQLLVEAALAAGRWKLARALLSERAFARPHSRLTWEKYAAVLERLGEARSAAVARRRAEEAAAA